MGSAFQTASKIASALLLFTMSISTVQAQDLGRVDQLEKRVGDIETKLDALIKLMTKQHSNATSSEISKLATDAQESSDSDLRSSGLKAGMTLDLYSVALGDEWPKTPPGFPVASAEIGFKQPFNLGASEEIPDLKRYANPTGSSIGQFFSGKIFLQETGQYVIQAGVSKHRRYDHDPNKCIALVVVDGMAIAVAAVDSRQGLSGSGLGTVELEGGLHSVGIWSVCNRRGHSDLTDIRFRSKLHVTARQS